MSDTPRTNLNHLTVETLRTMKGTGTKIVLASVARQLERELNAANERIKRLEEAGDVLQSAVVGVEGMTHWQWLAAAHEADLKWRSAKEAKP